MSAGSGPPDKRRGAPAGQPKPLNVAAATTPLDALQTTPTVRQDHAATPARLALVRRQLAERAIEAARRGARYMLHALNGEAAA